MRRHPRRPHALRLVGRAGSDRPHRRDDGVRRHDARRGWRRRRRRMISVGDFREAFRAGRHMRWRRSREKGVMDGPCGSRSPISRRCLRQHRSTRHLRPRLGPRQGDRQSTDLDPGVANRPRFARAAVPDTAAGPTALPRRAPSRAGGGVVPGRRAGGLHGTTTVREQSWHLNAGTDRKAVRCLPRLDPVCDVRTTRLLRRSPRCHRRGRVMDFGEVVGFGSPASPSSGSAPTRLARDSGKSRGVRSADRLDRRRLSRPPSTFGADVLYAPRLWPEYTQLLGAFVPPRQQRGGRLPLPA